MIRRQMLTGLALALLAGCASIERTSPGKLDRFEILGGEGKAESTAVSRNYGFGLFYLFTAICGDGKYNREKHDIEGGCLLFQDECNCSNCYLTLHDLAEDEGLALTNVAMVNNSLPSQGITGYIQMIGFVVEFEDVACSGVLRAYPAPQKTEGVK